MVGRLWTDLGIFVVDVPDGSPALAACAVGVLHRSLPSPRRSTEITGYLEWVVTDPGHRRRGHAGSATAALVAWLVAQGAAVIDVHSSADAVPVYRRLGFTDDGPVALRRRTLTAHGS
jgi:GNAT superfamily N-acetyltransferase